MKKAQFFKILDVRVYCCDKAQADKINHGSCRVKIKDGECVCAYCEQPSRNVVVPVSLKSANKSKKTAPTFLTEKKF